MDKHKQYTPLKVHNMSVKEWEETDHSHNYYEIIFIEKGKGVHVLNDVEILYKAGSVFVLNPIDHHHFHVHEFTHFISVRFTPAFITNCAGIPQELCNDLISKMESEEIRNARIQFYNEDQKSIYSIFQTVLSCQSNQSVVYFQILSIVQLILKSLQVKRKPVQAKKKDLLSHRVNAILHPQSYYRATDAPP
ncbi:AraC family ligand binding domain-containing protein [Fulvivirga maritima]|uniref:AraC family ligand binding domain-containing protein n=1 Tax=Fulvivirga maritima TaxID=2904247 RepID=UPI001F3595C9|nr:AraC family ligand binding domain-containing protein [Fulvivirga maritima]UII26369.1 AraC family ligand binding domain-containing protein [Fulvivirga maritima]